MFSPFVPNFSLVPSYEEKIRYVPREKNGTEEKIRLQVPDRWAGAGGSGGPGWRAGMAGRAGMGAGPGRGGDVRVPTLKCALE